MQDKLTIRESMDAFFTVSGHVFFMKHLQDPRLFGLPPINEKNFSLITEDDWVFGTMQNLTFGDCRIFIKVHFIDGRIDFRTWWHAVHSNKNYRYQYQ
uniref:Uncharacterized protein n=1 Tax=Romanomermis culicivorax TaxID=13658 RepID=A0A915IDT7_ROMCU